VTLFPWCTLCRSTVCEHSLFIWIHLTHWLWDHLQSMVNNGWQVNIIVATKEENVYVCARYTLQWIIHCHCYRDSDHRMNEIICKHIAVWIKLVCDTKSHNYRTEQKQVNGWFPVLPQKCQSLFHWICLSCSAKITVALLIKRVDTFKWCTCVASWSLLSYGMFNLMWMCYKYIKC
jgi:hypothetical protein